MKKLLKEPAQTDALMDAVRTGKCLVMPIYPLTAGLSQWEARLAVRQALFEHRLESPLPHALKERLSEAGWPGYRKSIGMLHGFVPIPHEWQEDFLRGTSPAHKRLAAEVIWNTISRMRGTSSRASMSWKLDADWLEKLPPFTLTGDQRRTINEIAGDLKDRQAMRRLVQGDVGSGKSIVAYLSAVGSCMAGMQVALMAPTEVLARQLYEGMREAVSWSPGIADRVFFLSGGTKTAERRRIEEHFASRAPGIVVGTHAVAGLEFGALGLVVIDEEQRFGLEIKERLLKNGAHYLMMSATPIPRTLAAGVYGGSKISVIAEKPPSRKPVETHLAVSREEKNEMVLKMKAAFEAGRQAFVVCPSIDGDEMISVQHVADGLAKIFGKKNVAVAHGDMPSDKMAEALDRFNAGRVSCLVATTVIEVGINVPNATIMVIADPHRLGLSQLHQIRGRVGRGEHGGTCYLSPQKEIGEKAMERLRFFASTDDGFKIAEYDMAHRGTGDLRTAEQSGKNGINYMDHGDVIQLIDEYLEEREAKRQSLYYPAESGSELEVCF